MFERERATPFVIRYALYLYFLGLSLMSKSKAIKSFFNRSYVAYLYYFLLCNIIIAKLNDKVIVF